MSSPASGKAAESLAERRCRPCEGGVPALSREQAQELMRQLQPGWTLAADGRSIAARFEFRNYYQTTAFINAVAWIAHQEDHHPEISFGYRQATVSYTTHAIGGLSENDFICAAKIDGLRRQAG